jgi:hypothetical protein
VARSRASLARSGSGNSDTGLLQEQKIEISLDGRDAWRANVFVERL